MVCFDPVDMVSTVINLGRRLGRQIKASYITKLSFFFLSSLSAEFLCKYEAILNKTSKQDVIPQFYSLIKI